MWSGVLLLQQRLSFAVAAKIERYLNGEKSTFRNFARNQELLIWALFCFPPPPKLFWKISENLITNRLEHKAESFSFKFILRVIV